MFLFVLNLATWALLIWLVLALAVAAFDNLVNYFKKPKR